MEKNKTLEAAFGELEETISRMDSGELSLDESFKLYQDGIKLLKYCNESIEKVEKKIIELKSEETEDEF